MADKIATREAYGDALAEFGATNENIVVLDADLAEATKTIKFKKKFPERFFDCGIAEQHAMTFAAGLAKEGYHPFQGKRRLFFFFRDESEKGIRLYSVGQVPVNNISEENTMKLGVFTTLLSNLSLEEALKYMPDMYYHYDGAVSEETLAELSKLLLPSADAHVKAAKSNKKAPEFANEEDTDL